MANRIETADGRTFSADDLSDFSFDLFQTAEHLESSEIVAKQLNFEGTEFKVATNYLFLKSLRVRKLSALRWLVLQSRSDVKSITSDFNVGDLGFPVSVVKENSEEQFITRKQALVFASKVLLHRLFRVFRKSRLLNSVVTRAWVEVTEALYPDALQKSHILIYPFALNLRRQARFIFRAFRHGRQVSLDGIPYRWSGLLLPFVASDRRFRKLIQLETEGYVLHGRELALAGVTLVRTSDEFEVAAVALYECLAQHGIASTNTAHGVGNYGPYQAYSKFAVLNAEQATFYKLRSSGADYLLHSHRNTSAPSVAVESGAPAVLVHIHQNFSDLGLVFEDRAQLALIEHLKFIAGQNQIRFIVKAHPNSSDNQIRALETQTGAAVEKSIKLGSLRPIFITLNSTAYFDFVEVGPVLFFKKGTLKPEVYFGESIVTVDEAGLRPAIESLMVKSEWQRARGTRLEHESST